MKSNIDVKTDVLVIGAGAAGLGAATWLRNQDMDFLVVEGNHELPLNMHNGVHYLHSIPELPFDADIREITLTDGIICPDGQIVHGTKLMYSLQYSEKVREIQHPSSIMDIGKHDKVYMPKSNSMNDTMKKCYEFVGSNSFSFGWWLQSIDEKAKIATFKKGDNVSNIAYQYIISAIPLDKFRTMVKTELLDSLKLECAPVHITNYKVERIVPNWMINLYVPDPTNPVYRVSILNGICSVESMRPLTDVEISTTRSLLSMFHLTSDVPDTFTWNTGKVISISKDDRDKVLEELHNYNIYQIGRFGLWNRKLLVDSTINQAKEVVMYISKKEKGQYTMWSEVKQKLV